MKLFEKVVSFVLVVCACGTTSVRGMQVKEHYNKLYGMYSNLRMPLFVCAASTLSALTVAVSETTAQARRAAPTEEAARAKLGTDLFAAISHIRKAEGLVLKPIIDDLERELVCAAPVVLFGGRGQENYEVPLFIEEWARQDIPVSLFLFPHENAPASVFENPALCTRPFLQKCVLKERTDVRAVYEHPYFPMKIYVYAFSADLCVQLKASVHALVLGWYGTQKPPEWWYALCRSYSRSYECEKVLRFAVYKDSSAIERLVVYDPIYLTHRQMTYLFTDPTKQIIPTGYSFQDWAEFFEPVRFGTRDAQGRLQFAAIPVLISGSGGVASVAIAAVNGVPVPVPEPFKQLYKFTRLQFSEGAQFYVKSVVDAHAKPTACDACLRQKVTEDIFECGQPLDEKPLQLSSYVTVRQVPCLHQYRYKELENKQLVQLAGQYGAYYALYTALWYAGPRLAKETSADFVKRCATSSTVRSAKAWSAYFAAMLEWVIMKDLPDKTLRVTYDALSFQDVEGLIAYLLLPQTAKEMAESARPTKSDSWPHIGQNAPLCAYSLLDQGRTPPDVLKKMVAGDLHCCALVVEVAPNRWLVVAAQRSLNKQYEFCLDILVADPQGDIQWNSLEEAKKLEPLIQLLASKHQTILAYLAKKEVEQAQEGLRAFAEQYAQSRHQHVLLDDRRYVDQGVYANLHFQNYLLQRCDKLRQNGSPEDNYAAHRVATAVLEVRNSLAPLLNSNVSDESILRSMQTSRDFFSKMINKKEQTAFQKLFTRFDDYSDQYKKAAARAQQHWQKNETEQATRAGKDRSSALEQMALVFAQMVEWRIWQGCWSLFTDDVCKVLGFASTQDMSKKLPRDIVLQIVSINALFGELARIAHARWSVGGGDDFVQNESRLWLAAGQPADFEQQVDGLLQQVNALITMAQSGTLDQEAYKNTPDVVFKALGLDRGTLQSNPQWNHRIIGAASQVGQDEYERLKIEVRLAREKWSLENLCNKETEVGKQVDAVLQATGATESGTDYAQKRDALATNVGQLVAKLCDLISVE